MPKHDSDTLRRFLDAIPRDGIISVADTARAAGLNMMPRTDHIGLMRSLMEAGCVELVHTRQSPYRVSMYRRIGDLPEHSRVADRPGVRQASILNTGPTFGGAYQERVPVSLPAEPWL